MKKNEVVLTEKNNFEKLLKEKALFDMKQVAKITGYNYRYLRILCAGQKVDHHKFLGRYYMSPHEVASLLQPVKKK